MRKIKYIAFILLLTLFAVCSLSGCGADREGGIMTGQSDSYDGIVEELPQEGEDSSTEQESARNMQENFKTSEAKSEAETGTETETGDLNELVCRGGGDDLLEAERRR